MPTKLPPRSAAEEVLSPEEFVSRLEALIAQGASDRLDFLVTQEHQYYNAVLNTLKGLVALVDAFNSLFLEATERLNIECRPKIRTPLSDAYPMFVPRLITAFRVLRAAQNVAFDGYALQGYTLLRNVFDDNVLTSAALQKVTTFYAIEGIDPGVPFDPNSVLKNRRKTEFEVTKLMTGQDSGLSVTTQEDLGKLNRLFDYETHGARLSLAGAMD